MVNTLLYTTIIYIYIVREDLPKLSYTTMCIKESLRLYPPVPFIAKQLSEDFYVEGKRIPKGVTYNNRRCYDNCILLLDEYEYMYLCYIRYLGDTGHTGHAS